MSDVDYRVNSEKESFARDAGITGLLDVYFDALADRRGRFLLYFLSTIPMQEIVLSELAEVVWAYESAGTSTQTPFDRDAVISDLHHRLLPKLDDAALIEYNYPDGIVRYTASPVFEAWLDLAQTTEITESK